MRATVPQHFPSVNSPRPVVWIVTTADHRYTLGDFPDRLAERGCHLEALAWEDVLTRRYLDGGTYVLTDFDRLSPSELLAAAAVYRRLKGAGLTVYNDPARMLRRDQLIARLRQGGLSSYHTWSPATGEMPDRYPVFLRAAAAHRGAISALLHDRAAAERRLNRAVEEGEALSDLIFIEYKGEAVDGTSHFQKHSAFRIGPNLFPANTVNQDRWQAKFGTAGLATDTQYHTELAEMESFPQRDHLAACFDATGIEFGRIDFGFANGKPEVWEINTNPSLQLTTEHQNADRVETMKIVQASIADALQAIATRPEGAVDVADAFKRSGNSGNRPRRQ